MTTARRWTADGPTPLLGELVDQVVQATGAVPGEPHDTVRTYLDTFDGDLWRWGQVLVVATVGDHTLLHLAAADDVDSEAVTGSAAVEGLPRWPSEVPRGRLQDAVAAAVGVRALLPLVQVQARGVALAVLDKHDKTVVRLVVERAVAEGHALPMTVHVLPVRGYDKALARVGRRLARAGLVPVRLPPLVTALDAVGRTPGPMLHVPEVRLTADERADAAVKRVLAPLLAVLRGTLQGTIDDVDSEFLHDFRVAVRRTRAVLGQLKGVFPPGVTARFADRFRWLGQVTGAARDLDVHLLHDRRYRKALPAELRDDLGPLRDYLQRRGHEAHVALSAELRGRPFLRLLADWQTFLQTTVPARPSAPRALAPIGELVRRRTRRALERVLDEGRAIDDGSPAEALHALRKSCKKLRYLLELFHTVLEDGPVDRCIRDLKALQTHLGDFQDQEVQATALAGFADDMRAEGAAPEATLVAIARLVDDLRAGQEVTRTEFYATFARFDRHKVRARFDTLLGEA